jgi:hypothetical protein
MGDKSITKVSSRTSPKGSQGQQYLGSGVRLSMRRRDDEPPKPGMSAAWTRKRCASAL